jgi:hypothetical protein
MHLILSLMPRWNLVDFFFPVFWNLIPCVTKQGVSMPSFSNFTDNFNDLSFLNYNFQIKD